jgi:methyl-accepting chemotaxis protein
MSNITRTGSAAIKVQPKTHFAIGAVIIGVVVISSAISAYLCLHFLSQVLEVVSQANTITEDMKRTLATMHRDLLLILVVTVVIVAIVVSVLLFKYLFRFTGAEFAINRHIEEKLLQGDLSPVKLRQDDFLQGLAANLNKFIEKVKGSGRS